MIDWLTMRHPINSAIGPAVHAKLLSHLGRVVLIGPDGSKQWEKPSLDVEALRSDTPGLFWTVQGDGDGRMLLVIGASPASLEHGVNVFGSDDVRHCAQVLIRFASEALGSILPRADAWECRRIDVTHNYDLGTAPKVKQALRYLMATDSSRRKAGNDSRGGDSVYWSKTSDLRSGKAYHKGPQLDYLVRKNKTLATDEQISLANRLLRLELKLGSRWFRRLEAGQIAGMPCSWLDLTPSLLNAQHGDFFQAFIGRIEVSDMTTLQARCEQAATTIKRTRDAYCSPRQGYMAYRTWTAIRQDGYDHVKGSMPVRTFSLHLRILRNAGMSDADLCAGNVIPFRRTVLELSRPVTSWAELRRAA